MRLSVIVPSLTGDVPKSLSAQLADRSDVELVVVKGVRPVGKARNEGLRWATGDYIAWVDADDEVEADWLKEIMRAMVPRPDVIVFGYTWMRGERSGIVRAWQGGDLLAAVLSQRTIRGGLCSELWFLVTRREMWDGVRFDDTARTMEDWAVMPCALAKAKRVVAIEKPLYRYCAHTDSLTHQMDETMQREVFKRAVGRIAEVKRLGLWEKYGRIALVGAGYAVYCCAETLMLGGNAASPTRRDSVRWIRGNLPALLLSPARSACKVKWVLASLGLWGIVRWYYVRIQGRKI